MPNVCRSSSTAERTGICTDLYELAGAASHFRELVIPADATALNGGAACQNLKTGCEAEHVDSSSMVLSVLPRKCWCARHLQNGNGRVQMGGGLLKEVGTSAHIGGQVLTLKIWLTFGDAGLVWTQVWPDARSLPTEISLCSLSWQVWPRLKNVPITKSEPDPH